jgi:hypothetical protein
VGVIGVALFPERAVRQPPALYAPPSTYGQSSSAPRDKSSSYDDLSAPMGDKLEGLSDAPAAAPSAMPAPSSSGRASSSPRERSDEALSGAAANSSAQRRARSGLGTEFGEAVSSEIRQVEFVRAHASRPSVVLGARYNDRTGLYALGIDVDDCTPSDLALRQSANPFPVSRQFARPPADWRHD